MTSSPALPDGLAAMRQVLSLSEVMRLIEETARWVDPATFRLLPVWYPEFARRADFYKANWTEPQMNRNRQSGLAVHKQEGNVHANKALTQALGLRAKDRPGWSCCHIWGLDDSTFQSTNKVVQDHRYFSCVANVVLLPTPLKAFTDVMPEVKTMLRVAAYRLYGWSCGHEDVAEAKARVESWTDWDAYPVSWAKGDVPGIMPLTDGVRAAARRRVARLRYDRDHAGVHYPRDEVAQTLAYWGVDLDAWPET